MVTIIVLKIFKSKTKEIFVNLGQFEQEINSNGRYNFDGAIEKVPQMGQLSSPFVHWCTWAEIYVQMYKYVQMYMYKSVYIHGNRMLLDEKNYTRDVR